jgi:hypothetical protein
LRLHDGTHWTPHVADGNAQSVDPIEPARTPWKDRVRIRAALIIGPVALALIGLGVALTLIVQVITEDSDTTGPDLLPSRLAAASCTVTVESLRLSAAAYRIDHAGVWPFRIDQLVPDYMDVPSGVTIAVNGMVLVGPGWTITLAPTGGGLKPQFIETDC